MLRSALPPIDPDYLISERHPDNLDAYARGLWKQLQDVRSKTSTNDYTIEDVKAAFVWLSGQYSQARAPIPIEFSYLIGGLIEWNPRQSTLPVHEESADAYRAAITFESTFPPDPKGEKPSIASEKMVARHICGMLRSVRKHPTNVAPIDSARATVRSWRSKVHYRDNVSFQRDPAKHFENMKRRMRHPE